MQAYDEVVELARICASQMPVTKSDDEAAELRRMAENYRSRAAQLAGGVPDLGESPDMAVVRHD